MSSNFDFNTLLSPHDFELFCKDLFSDYFRANLKAYREGRDEGIDLRGHTNDGKYLVVQCKRVKNFSISEIEKEAKKVNKIKPDRYRFITIIDCPPIMGRFVSIKV